MTFTCIKKNTTVRWHTIRTLHTFGDVQQNIKLTSDVLQYVWPQKWKKLNCNIDTVWYSKYYRKVTNKTGEHKKRTDAMRWRISIKKKRVTTPQLRKRKSDALRQSSQKTSRLSKLDFPACRELATSRPAGPGSKIWIAGKVCAKKIGSRVFLAKSRVFLAQI